jgi:MOSC domain-containing protein YiiM
LHRIALHLKSPAPEACQDHAARAVVRETLKPRSGPACLAVVAFELSPEATGVATGAVISVNVSASREVNYHGKTVTTGIFKTPVEGKVALRGVNLRGDDQADREVHGGPVRAVYAYAEEDYEWWRERRGEALPPGKFGENVTLRGVDVNGALIGERWRIGSAVLQVTVPRVPCYKLAMAMDDPNFVREFAQALRPGTYLTVYEEGEVAIGDPVEIAHRPDHTLTVAEVARLYLFDRARLGEMLRAPELPASWRDWVLEQTASVER